MGIETEYKYKIKNLPGNLDYPINISQYYIKPTEEVLNVLKDLFWNIDLNSIHTFRIRKIIDCNKTFYVITLKTKSILYSRKEYEKEVGKDIFDLLTRKDLIDSLIIKNRFIHKVGSRKYEFDEYLNLNKKLYTCEVEVNEVGEKVKEEIENTFTDYFGVLDFKDVSFNRKYKNSNLVEAFGLKKDIYGELIKNIDCLSNGVKYDISILANAASLLFNRIDNINWLGFYLLKNDELLLGPFMGEPACTVLKRGRGVCFKCVELGKSLIVDNVLLFDGHIACDAKSRSEMVIPIYNHGKIYGVLDIDSASYYRFGEIDKMNLEIIVNVLEKYLFE